MWPQHFLCLLIFKVWSSGQGIWLCTICWQCLKRWLIAPCFWLQQFLCLRIDLFMVSKFLWWLRAFIIKLCNCNLGFTRLQASTDFACIGENVTFSCTTLNSFLIWDVIFADRTIQSVRYLFEVFDTPGRVNSESTHGVHLYFLLVSKTNGTLDSILVARASASLENAIVECEGTEVHSLTFRFARKCHDYIIIILNAQ